MKIAQTPTVPSLRARPPLRPMHMLGPYHQLGPGKMRAVPPFGRPRLYFPHGPPRYMKASPPLHPSTSNSLRISPPPRHMQFFRSPSPTHGLIRITPRHLPPNFRPRCPGKPSPLGVGSRMSPPPLRTRQYPPMFSPRGLRYTKNIIIKTLLKKKP